MLLLLSEILWYVIPVFAEAHETCGWVPRLQPVAGPETNPDAGWVTGHGSKKGKPLELK